MVSIRMKRVGTKKKPYFRIVVADSRSPRDGKFIEELGYYHPIAKEGEQLKVDLDKVKQWFMNGAEPSLVVRRLLNKSNFRFDRALLTK